MEENVKAANHKLVLDGRKRAQLSGIKDVISFDAKEILLETTMGLLTVKGDELHVNRLTLEKGEVDIEGKVDSLTYSDKGMNKGEDSFLKRLFQ